MHILLTNDDGIFAPGLAAMYKQLRSLGDVSVVAPADVRSGAGHSISLSPVFCDKVEIAGKFTGYSVNGSPADCVKLAVMELLESPVDLVVSGMNEGANVGINVYYSGTVAAAMESAFYSIPAVAVSAAWEEKMDYDALAGYAMNVIEKVLPINSGFVLNINIPRLSKGSPRAVRVVPQSTDGFDESYITRRDSDGQTVYQLAGGRHRDKKHALTDTAAIYEGYITMTALHFNMTDYEQNQQLEKLDINSDRNQRKGNT